MTTSTARVAREGVETLDAEKLTTRQLNSAIKRSIANGVTSFEILNPDARHNLAVGIIGPCSITFRGSVGYYCSSYCDDIEVRVDGNSGWGLGDNLMRGRLTLNGDAGASAGASMRGGEILVNGNAGARAGISMKGGELIITGNSGFLTGFMMQKGRIVVLGNVGDACGDSMYEGVVYFGGEVDSLGADAKVESVPVAEDRRLRSDLRKMGVKEVQLPKSFRKVVSTKKLYHYDSLEPLERERLVI